MKARPSTRLRFLSAMGAAALALVVSTACSSSSSKPNFGSSGDPSKSTLTFGTISDDSGPVVLSAVSDGTEAWAKYVNTHGGLDGHPVKIIRCDDKLDATRNAACARQMIQDKSVLAVIGGQTVATPLVAASLLDKAGLPYIATEPTGGGELEGNNLFAISGGPISQFAAMSKYFPTHGAKRVAIVIEASPSSTLAGEQAAKEVQAAGGTAVSTVYPQIGSPDWSPVAAQLISAKPDVIFLGFQPSDMAPFIRAVRALSSTVKLSSLGSQWPSSTIQAVGSMKEGIYEVTDWAPFEANSTDPQVSAMTASLASIGKSASLGQSSLSGWYGGRVIEAAITGMGNSDITRTSLAAYLRTASLTVQGIPVKIAKPTGTAPNGYDALANPSAYINQFSGDTLKEISLIEDAFPSS